MKIQLTIQLKLQRNITDVNDKKKTGRINSSIGIKNHKKYIRETNAISHTNININKNSNKNNKNLGNLNKSIENHYNHKEKYRLSKTSALSQRRKRYSKNFNKTLLIERISMNRKENPFFNNNS